MAIRTTAGEVKGTLLNDYDGVSNLEPFIRRASLFISNVITLAAERGFTISSALSKELETLMACYFYCCTDRTYASRSTDNASGSFDGKTGMGLDANFYGQQAKLMDPSGSIAALSGGRVGIAVWLGRPPSEQTDYVDRD